MSKRDVVKVDDRIREELAHALKVNVELREGCHKAWKELRAVLAEESSSSATPKTKDRE